MRNHLEASTMGSKVVVTYKRKRLFSRGDHSPINLHSDRPSEISDLKTSASFNNDDESIVERTLQKKDAEFGTCHEYSKGKVGENVLQCENCNSQYCGQCSQNLDNKSQRLCSACTNQQDSSVSNQTKKLNIEQNTHSQESHVKQVTFHVNVLGQKSFAIQSKSLSVETGLEYEVKGKEMCSNDDKSKEISSISPTPDAFSGIESDAMCSKISDGINRSRQMNGASILETSLEERNKLDKDQCIRSCNNLVMKRKLTSTLITFCRRSKRNRDIAATAIASECMNTHVSEAPLDASFLVDVKNEKKPPEDNDNSHSFSAPAEMVMRMDNPVHTVDAQAFPKPHEEMSAFEENNNCWINVTPQGLSSNGDVNTTRMLSSNVPVKRGSISSLDLTISPPASRDIDCNIPIDCDSDENHPSRHLEDFRDSLGSSSKTNKNAPTLKVECAGSGSPVTTASDKGKFIVESPPENIPLQLFPEKSSNDQEKTTQLLSSSLQSSCAYKFPLHSEQMVNNSHARYPSLYEWPHVQPREPLHDFLPSTSDRANSLSRHLMMLDNILTRARAVRGNTWGLFDTLESQIAWSEEELDCLWIGVRRHGRGNWDIIIRDPRLHFSPWKTARDLAERWQEEQYRLFYGGSVSQVTYANRPNFLSDHSTGFLHSRAKGPVNEVQLSLGVQQNPLHERGAHKRPPIHFMNLARHRQFQNPVTNGYLSKAGFVKGNLPHWLREAVEIPPRPPGPARNVVPSVCNPNYDCSVNSQQSWLNTRNAPIQRTTEPQNAGAKGASRADPRLVMKHVKRECGATKKDDLIVITSDASSEETISDDHSGVRP